MSDFQDQLAADVSNVFLNTDEFAASYTYNPFGGSPKSVIAVKEEKLGGPRDQQHSRTTLRSANFHIADHGATGIALPTDRDTITDGSVTWTFKEIVEHDHVGGMWNLEFTTSVLNKQGFRSPGNM